jgi:hypothetical protein
MMTERLRVATTTPEAPNILFSQLRSMQRQAVALFCRRCGRDQIDAMQLGLGALRRRVRVRRRQLLLFTWPVAATKRGPEIRNPNIEIRNKFKIRMS